MIYISSYVIAHHVLARHFLTIQALKSLQIEDQMMVYARILKVIALFYRYLDFTVLKFLSASYSFNVNTSLTDRKIHLDTQEKFLQNIRAHVVHKKWGRDFRRAFPIHFSSRSKYSSQALFLYSTVQ